MKNKELWKITRVVKLFNKWDLAIKSSSTLLEGLKPILLNV